MTGVEITRGTVASSSAQKTTDKALAAERAPEEKSTPAPKPKPAKKPAAKAKAPHKAKHEALVAFQGGPLDGQTGTVGTHDDLVIEHDDVAHYHRTDQQQGDYRVYRYAPEEGSAPGVELRAAPEQENILQRDLDEHDAREKAAEKKAAKKA